MHHLIIDVRNRAGLSQAELAKRVNRSQAAVAAMENGTRKLPVDVAQHLVALARVNGAPLRLEDFYAPVLSGRDSEKDAG